MPRHNALSIHVASPHHPTVSPRDAILKRNIELIWITDRHTNSMQPPVKDAPSLCSSAWLHVDFGLTFLSTTVFALAVSSRPPSDIASVVASHTFLIHPDTCLTLPGYRVANYSNASNASLAQAGQDANHDWVAASSAQVGVEEQVHPALRPALWLGRARDMERGGGRCLSC